MIPSVATSCRLPDIASLSRFTSDFARLSMARHPARECHWNGWSKSLEPPYSPSHGHRDPPTSRAGSRHAAAGAADPQRRSRPPSGLVRARSPATEARSWLGGHRERPPRWSTRRRGAARPSPRSSGPWTASRPSPPRPKPTRADRGTFAPVREPAQGADPTSSATCRAPLAGIALAAAGTASRPGHQRCDRTGDTPAEIAGTLPEPADILITTPSRST